MNEINNLRTQNTLLKQYVAGLERQNSQRNRQAVIMQQPINTLKYQMEKKCFQKCQSSNNSEKKLLKNQIEKLNTQKANIMKQFKQMQDIVVELEKIQPEVINKGKQIHQLKQQNKYQKKQLQKLSNLSQQLANLRSQLQQSTKQRMRLKNLNQSLKQENKTLTKAKCLLEKQIQSSQLKTSYNDSEAEKDQEFILDDRYSFGYSNNTNNKNENNSQQKQLNKCQRSLEKQRKNEIYLQNTEQKCQQYLNERLLELQNKNYLMLKKINKQQIQIQQSNKIIQQLKKQNQYISQIQQQFFERVQQVEFLKRSINSFEEGIQQRDKIINNQANSLKKLQKGILQLDEERLNEVNKYKAIIEEKSNQLVYITQSYNEKISILNNQVQKDKISIDELKSNNNNQEINYLRNILRDLQNFNHRVTIQLEQKQHLISQLKRQNQNLMQINKNITGVSKQYYQTPTIIYSPNRTIINTNNLQQEKQKIYNKRVKGQDQQISFLGSHKKKQIIGRFYHTPTHNHTKTEFQQMNNVKKHTPNPKYYVSHQRANTLSTNIHNYKKQSAIYDNQDSTKTCLNKNIPKQAQLESYNQNYNEINQDFSQQKVLTSNYNIYKRNKKIKYQGFQGEKLGNEQKWKELQKRINNLRKQNINLKKNILS